MLIAFSIIAVLAGLQSACIVWYAVTTSKNVRVSPSCGRCGYPVDPRAPFASCPECGSSIALVGAVTRCGVHRHRASLAMIVLACLIFSCAVGFAGKEALHRWTRGSWPPPQQLVASEEIEPRRGRRYYPQLRGREQALVAKRDAFYERTGVRVDSGGQAEIDRTKSEMYRLSIALDGVCDSPSGGLSSGVLDLIVLTEGVPRSQLVIDVADDSWSYGRLDTESPEEDWVSGNGFDAAVMDAVFRAAGLSDSVYLREESLALAAAIDRLRVQQSSRGPQFSSAEVPPGKVTPDGRLFSGLTRVSPVMTPILPRVFGFDADKFSRAVAAVCGVAFFIASLVGIVHRRARLIRGTSGPTEPTAE